MFLLKYLQIRHDALVANVFMKVFCFPGLSNLVFFEKKGFTPCKEQSLKSMELQEKVPEKD